MAEITVKCPNCGVEFQCDESCIGMKDECWSCKQNFIIQKKQETAVLLTHKDEDAPAALFQGDSGIKKPVRKKVVIASAIAICIVIAIICIVSSNSSDSLYEKGKVLYAQEKYSEAAECFRKAAEQGNVDAQNELGVMYYAGHGVQQNYKEAEKWYRKAAEQGNADAQFGLGFLLTHGNGLDFIQNNKVLSAEGKGIEGDNGEGREWLKKAANQGHIRAKIKLGVEYSVAGYGDPLYKEAQKLCQEAAEWYQKADENGDAEGLYELGNLYRCLKDRKEEEKWLLKAAGKGHVKAKAMLGSLYMLQNKFKESLKWYHEAAEQGDGNSQELLGAIYHDAVQDYVEAAKWFRMAAEQGKDVAQFYLGLMYYNGQGVAQDPVKGLKWIREAAKRGNTNAKKALAELEK